MVKEKSKYIPIKAIKLRRYYGSVTIELTPDDFIDLISRKNLIIIGLIKPVKGWYYYSAFEEGLQYFTRSKQELTELQVDIIVPRMRV
ncbi:MAG: hypothetical protein ACFFCO_10910 [Promethearchaeota archaeon]